MKTSRFALSGLLILSGCSTFTNPMNAFPGVSWFGYASPATLELPEPVFARVADTKVDPVTSSGKTARIVRDGETRARPDLLAQLQADTGLPVDDRVAAAWGDEETVEFALGDMSPQALTASLVLERDKDGNFILPASSAVPVIDITPILVGLTDVASFAPPLPAESTQIASLTDERR